ncbi:hypothetical protein VHEMI01267 [[Torrubiella] hemipterigena]|uniref:Uncharacterized protein n=1 Tax=[Torrubiella] hemipterigena TaxID=1531966 RepID=A0A0A1T4B9_9HYPO|nr:hypothetical protein VHEMI01267 [[Torrubiella] hemipterigena]
MHAEQMSLIDSGTFATTLSNILASLPGLEVLRMTDMANDTKSELRGNTVQTAKMVMDDGRLQLHLATSLSWGTERLYQARWERNEQTAPVTLLYDIPVALTRGGVRLRGLSVRCEATANSSEQLITQRSALRGTACEIQRGLSSLEMLHYNLTRLTEPNDAVVLRRCRLNAAEYIKLAITSEYLAELIIELPGLHKSSKDIGEAYGSLEKALGRMANTSLSQLQLGHVSLTADELRDIIERYGDKALLCKLYSVYLNNGSWASVLDTVRAKIGLRVRDGSCSFQTEELNSLEMWNHYHDKYQKGLTEATIQGVLWINEVQKAIKQYVAGQEFVNPMMTCNLPFEPLL